MGAGTARAALTAVLVAALLVLSPATARPVPGCQALQVRSHGADSTLHRIDLATGEDSRIGPLPAHVDALGHSRERGVTYGLAAGFVDGAHALAVRPDGSTRDRGPVRGRRGNPLELPESGAIAGNRWYVVEDEVLYTVDVDRLRVLAAVELEPLDFGDLDVDPVDGRLYAVSDSGGLVRIDRTDGSIEPVVDLAGLRDDHYGSLVIGRWREIYVSGHAGVLYRAERDGSVRRLGKLEFATASDMAGCLAAPQPPPGPTPPGPTPPGPTPPGPTPPGPTPPGPTPPGPTPPEPTPPGPTPPGPTPPEPTPPEPTPPEPTSTPGPSPTPTPSRPEPAPAPTKTTPPEPPTPSTAAPRPRPSTSGRPSSTPTRAPLPETPPTDDEVEPMPTETTTSSQNDGEVENTGHSTEEKRRWAVAMLVVILGGGLAVRRLR